MTPLGYPIVVGQSIAAALRRFVRARDARFIVLADARVTPRARLLTQGVKGREAVLSLALGERRKRLTTVQSVLAALLRAGADRQTLVIGVGGGVASDLFGFAASIYMRGVPYAHVATSLLAMVDAAIGGKTGVDLAEGKNLAGSFSDPIAVFADVDALATLPERNLRDGLAEMVKHAIISGDDLFERLETLAPHAFGRWPWESIIVDAITVKAEIVALDPDEHGVRETLNLGHTFAHAIERESGYRVSHGAAVGVGLRAAGLLALRTGRFSAEEHLRVLTLLALLKLPLSVDRSPAKIFTAMFADKKKKKGRLRFVLPRALGDVEYGVQVPDAEVKAVLRLIVRPPGAREFR